MILRLFLAFLKIGAVSFGGGYGMISLIRETVLSNGWLTEGDFLSFIAVSESTPGPLAVNMATFIGSSQGGFWGAVLATIGVVTPAFCIILLIATIVRNLLKYRGVQAALGGVRPAVIGLIVATAITLFLSVVFNLKTVKSEFNFDWRALAIFAVTVVIHCVYKHFKKKKISPILLILISAAMGMALYSIGA